MIRLYGLSLPSLRDAPSLRNALALAAIALCLTVHSAAADVSLDPESSSPTAPVLFSDGMVLQRDMPLPVWGRANPGESVAVSIASQTKSAVADGSGHWRVTLDPLVAGGPLAMTIEGNNTITLSDILVGDVWVCAGQSNMVIRRARAADLAANPEIRALARSGRWGDRASGVAFAFAKEVHAATGVPIGIINRAAGGTAIRPWLAPEAATDTDPDVQAIVGGWSSFGEQFAAQLAPVAGGAIRGVVYWQGEQDLKLARQEIGSVEHYYYLLPALIRSWRAAWQRSDLPFVLVQLPTGGGIKLDEEPDALPPEPETPDIATLMRRATFNGLSEPDTALTISVDIDGGVHPRDRALYAHRIANAARGSAYGESFEYSGPVYASMSIESGNHVRLAFKPNTADGLQAIGGPLQGFAISGDGENFVWAEAAIEGSEVVVWNDAVPSPTVVRYAWARTPTWANLFNAAGLGAAPFSTDEHPAP